MKIYFSNAGIWRFAVKRTLQCALQYLAQPSDKLEMSLSVVSEQQIKTLNAKTRGVDRVTDVLSFPAVEAGRQVIDVRKFPSDINYDTGRLNVGDVVICLAQAKRQAQSFGHGVKREICFLAVHGLLHLLGYDHENAQDEEQMTALQREILQKAGITR